MKLSELLRGVAIVEAAAADPEISGVCYDSRRLKRGDCFVAVAGVHTDGHRFVETALRDGAAAALVERRVGAAWPQVVVTDTRQALALASAAFFGHPSRALVLFGVTGTDGKTTTTSMLHEILQAAGWGAAAMTTVELRVGSDVRANDTRQTTLEAPEIQAFLARARDAHLRAAVLETSSHGLALHRVAGCDYDVAVFTNVSHEHLDFHGTFAAYRDAKASLIDLTAASAGKGVPKTAVLNRDDPSFGVLAARPIARQLTYGVELAADVHGRRVVATASGLQVEASTPRGPLHLDLRVLGRWNALNALAALTAAIAVDIPLEAIARGLHGFSGVPGRMERVDAGQPFRVVVDYAHTPQSLETVLRELRPITPGRLIAVFGSAGDRDREKRSWMGEIAARLADRAVFTSEDPREEDPSRILEEIAAGADGIGWQRGQQYECIVDRREGIGHAIAVAREGDTVLLAGKGHERSIIIGRAKHPWDEREAALDAIRSRS